MSVDRTACAHFWESTDVCGLAIKCVLCKKPIGNLRHREHKHHWSIGVMTPSIKPTPQLPPKKCDTFGCLNQGVRYFALAPGTNVWLCAECVQVQENIKEPYGHH